MNETLKPSPQPPTDPAQARTRMHEGMRRMIKDGAIDLALNQIEQTLKSVPNDPDLWALRALGHEHASRLDEAYTSLGRASDLRPTSIEFKAGQARLASMRHNEADEVKCLAAAVGLGPVPDRMLLRLIMLHSKRQEFAEALAVADKLVASKPDHEFYHLKRAAVLSEAGRVPESRAVLEKLIAAPNPSDQAFTTWAALVAERLGDFPVVIDRIGRAIAAGHASATMHACLGKALSRVDRAREAIDSFRRAVEIDPAAAAHWFDMGVLQRQIGDLDDSQASILRSLELEPTNAGALRVAGYEHKYAYGDETFKRVNVALSNVDTMTKNQQVEVHYAVAKAMEDVGELEAAFGHYARAGRIQKELTPWSDTRMRGVLALLRNYLTPADYEAVRKQATPTKKPVFIVGMPRSGTTLLEQVIASHPQAFGAGELKLGAGIINGLKIGRAKLETMYDGKAGTLADGVNLSIPERAKKYLEVIEGFAGPKPTRVVDKMPGNYNWVGVLDAVIPGSHFIHARRHPVEICLSEYRIFFPDGINFSYDLRDLGKAYRLYNEYMKHWSQLMGDKILHVRYEDMVADLEGQARRIIDYLGLPWDDACLKFYENERKVLTASVTQVRKPIYTSSTNRWRKYEAYLKPLLEELGPLVAEYEAELAEADAKRNAQA